MTLRLPEGLIARLDFERAVVEETSKSPDLLPSHTAEAVGSERASELAQLVQANTESGFEATAQETIWASKGRYRHRPVAALPLRERVTLRALVNELVDELGELDRSYERYQSFERDVLHDSTARYVVIADVSSFYYYIDHGHLQQRLVDAAGRADTALAVRELLTGIANRQFGLPQGHYVSDWLSEQILSPIDRRLLRRGLSITRYADDFRIGASTWREAHRILEELSSELYGVGLTLNEEKSRILKRTTYEEHVGRIEEKLEERLTEAQVDMSHFDPYTGVTLSAADQDVAVEGLSRFFVEAAEERLQGGLSPQNAALNRRMLRMSLGSLARVGAPAAVSYAARLLNTDPSLVDRYGAYLRAVTQAGFTQEVSAAIDSRIGGGQYVAGWELAWLAESLIVSSAISGLQADVMSQMMDSRGLPGTLRARASIALASHSKVDVDVLLRLYEEVAAAARPDVVAALALRASTGQRPKVRSAIADHPLYEWIFDRVLAGGAEDWL